MEKEENLKEKPNLEYLSALKSIKGYEDHLSKEGMDSLYAIINQSEPNKNLTEWKSYSRSLENNKSPQNWVFTLNPNGTCLYKFDDFGDGSHIEYHDFGIYFVKENTYECQMIRVYDADPNYHRVEGSLEVRRMTFIHDSHTDQFFEKNQTNIGAAFNLKIDKSTQRKQVIKEYEELKKNRFLNNTVKPKMRILNYPGKKKFEEDKKKKEDERDKEEFKEFEKNFEVEMKYKTEREYSNAIRSIKGYDDYIPIEGMQEVYKLIDKAVPNQKLSEWKRYEYEYDNKLGGYCQENRNYVLTINPNGTCMNTYYYYQSYERDTDDIHFFGIYFVKGNLYECDLIKVYDNESNRGDESVCKKVFKYDDENDSFLEIKEQPKEPNVSIECLSLSFKTCKSIEKKKELESREMEKNRLKKNVKYPKKNK